MKELAIGIRPCSWYDEAKIDESIRSIKEGGFEAVDISFRYIPIETYDEKTGTSFFDKSLEELYAYYEPLKKCLKEQNIYLAQVHGVDPVGPDKGEEKSTCITRAAIRQIELCQYLDCPCIVFHFWRNIDATKEEEQRVNLMLLRKLIPAAKRCGVKICLENLYLHVGAQCEDSSGSDAVEASWYIDALNEEAGEVIFGACVDTGHAHLLRRNLYKHIITLGHRVYALHINENMGREDTHMIPYTQLNNCETDTAIDWERFIKALREIEFRGSLSFEIKSGLELLPEECRKEGMQLVSSIGKYFRKRILE